MYMCINIIQPHLYVHKHYSVTLTCTCTVSKPYLYIEFEHLVDSRTSNWFHFLFLYVCIIFYHHTSELNIKHIINNTPSDSFKKSTEVLNKMKTQPPKHFWKFPECSFPVCTSTCIRVRHFLEEILVITMTQISLSYDIVHVLYVMSACILYNVN